MKIFLKTFGCSYNFAESEIMAGILQEKGHQIVNELKDCDVAILNSCTVKNSADTKFLRSIKEAEDLNKKIILAGCYTQARKSHFLNSKYPVIGTFNITNILELVNQNSLNQKSILSTNDEFKLNNPRVLTNKIVGIIPISQGCLDACTYCLTRFARGKLHSYKKEDILQEIFNLTKKGVKEIWLTSQDDGCYGFDLGYNLVDLLKLILENKEKIKSLTKDGFIKIRIGMANPRHFLTFYKDLIEILKDDIFYKFLHIPIQSGSNKVLLDMKRNHSVEDFIKMVNDFKKEIPEILIATDIIVGFPTETQEDFHETMSLMKIIDFDVVNVSRFWVRPYTQAAKMKQLDSKVIKERSLELSNYYYSRIKEKNEKYVGKIYKNCLMDEIGTNNTSKFRNENYKQIVVNNLFNKGQIKDIEIIEAKTHHLIGKTIN
ncbi:MAG: tRNA (N(6)-L-threonylcarbamoyladenosine(37)-C(2))-methylthiotransferase [Candidatus Nanoarchaeia archaeon]|nr:tRNA (N(6)-L-threonylcarbamoyladenosine(37)-C(2))-methylthiotransferase [Candidatus Nanoarchaeia archaeon]